MSTHLLLWALALAAGGAPQADGVLAAAPLWAAPKRSSKAPPPRAADTVQDDKDDKDDSNDKKAEPARAKTREKAAASTREHTEKPAKPRIRRARATTTAAAKPTAALEAEVFGGEPEATVRQRPSKARKDDDGDEQDDQGEQNEHDEDDDEASTLPVIAPRLLAAAVGGSVMGRSFSFDAPLQRESAVRGGYALTLESFPFLWTRHWLGRLGLGAALDREMGSASIAQTDGGVLSYAVNQGRWSADVRYAAPLGERVVLVPRLGFGRSSYDVERKMESAPSTCVGASTRVCLPDVGLTHLVLGLELRLAINEAIALNADGAFLPATSVDKSTGQIGSEASPTARGYSAALAVTWQLAPWLALRAALPLVRYSYAWNSTAVPYKTASETYYGLMIGAAVATNR